MRRVPRAHAPCTLGPPHLATLVPLPRPLGGATVPLSGLIQNYVTARMDLEDVPLSDVSRPRPRRAHTGDLRQSDHLPGFG